MSRARESRHKIGFQIHSEKNRRLTTPEKSTKKENAENDDEFDDYLVSKKVRIISY
ncbi:MAG: hypothetical protein WBZ36_25425 [Candidatus Nitrosopolaris sp.]|jgi:hypothetical protein